MKDFNKYFIVGTNSDALHDTMNGTVIGELIRCKDCKHSKPIDSEWLECQHDKRVMKENGFCSWAEKNEDE